MVSLAPVAIPAAQSHSTPQVALVTGASSGLGRAVAVGLHEAGYAVFAASRHLESWKSCIALPRLTPFVMDVTSDASVDAGVQRILQQAGRLDLLVNNAGFGVAGPFEETPLQAGQSQMETNFFGAARVCRAVLPSMRARRAGCIINISSIGGRLGLPFQSYYAASKFALEGLTEALRYELEPHRVNVTLLEPGNFATQFTQNRRTYGGGTGSPYEAACRGAVSVMEKDERGGSDPQTIVAAVLRAARGRPPPLRRAVGPVFEVAGVWLSTWVPRRFFDWMFRRVMGIHGA